MLQEILELPNTILVIVCYVPDMSVLQVIKQYVLRKNVVHPSYMETVEDSNKLKYVYKDVVIPPMLGEKWYVEVNIDKLGSDVVNAIMHSVNENSVTVCYTTNYGTYKRLADSQMVNCNSNIIYTLYGGRLTAKDVYYTHEELRKQGLNVLSDSLLNYVVRNYRNDVPKYFEILHKIKSGEVFRARADIVTAVGLGAMTATSLVVDVLSADLSTDRKQLMALRKWLQAVNDLLHNVDSNTLLKQMQYACKDIVSLKLLQIRGLVVGNRREITDERIAQGVNRLRKYESQIFEEVTLLRAMWLLRELSTVEYRYVITETFIIQKLYNYVKQWKINEE